MFQHFRNNPGLANWSIIGGFGSITLLEDRYDVGIFPFSWYFSSVKRFLKIILKYWCYFIRKSEYDQEIPQSQTADNPVAPRGRAAQPSRDTRKTN